MEIHVKVEFVAEEQAELIPLEVDSSPLEPNEVAGRTLVSLISAGTELNIYLGNYHRAGRGWGHLPFTPGYAAVFRVEEVGDAVDDIVPGDLAFCMGEHQTWQRLPHTEVLTVPAGLSPDHAVFARMMNVTMSTLTTTAARPPETVLVTGLGIVGYLGAKIFDACGYNVIACDPLEVRRTAAQRNGLQQVLTSVPADDPAVAGKVALVLECSGHEAATRDGCRVVQPGGEVVQVGVPMTRRTEIYAQEILNLVFNNYVVLRGGKEQQIPLHPTSFRHNSNFGNMAAGLKWLAEERVGLGDIYAMVSPHTAQDTYQQILHRRRDELAILFDWTTL